MRQAKVGIIGGSGLYTMEGLRNVEKLTLSTPFGPPSDDIVVGDLDGVPTAFLPRHGAGHRISPSELPARANVWAMKSLGVTHLISVSAVGSLREDIVPRDVVIPDQILDRTKGVRPATFFGDGLVAHIAFAEPYCPELCGIIYDVATELNVAMVHKGGTMIVMEGPQFSTKAESNFYRQIGGDIIGMTALPEAKLAREAEICYCTLAMVTDYDCWRESEEAVTVDMVVENLMANTEASKAIVRRAIPHVAEAPRDCGCAQALENAIITSPEAIPGERREALKLLVGKYLD
ncbi:MAG: S-methyl-5'-thioadenosine phosphorylase [Chloroflexota bacterium]|nr:S-methyl-5'-thioadenosine phosphorylase [Chloroflexota bacterium]